MKLRRSGFRVVGAACALLALGITGCSGRGAPRRAHETPATPVPVTVHVVEPGYASSLLLPGRIAAREEVTITATVAARLTGLPLLEGATFRAGEILARFEAPEAREALEAARASLDAATLRRDLARTQEARMESLLADRVASLRELEGAQAERRAAEAAFAGARASVAARASGTAIEAPFDGVVVRRLADPGASLTPGMPILDIRSRGAGELTAAIPESEAGRLAEARAYYQIGSGPWHKAALIRVDGMTDFRTRTRVARFRALERASGFEAGSFVRIRLEPRRSANRPDAGAASWSRSPLAVPASGLVRRGGLTGVYVITGGRASLRWIRIGEIQDGRIQVLAGLSPGDSVALDPARLADGVRVAPATPASPASPPLADP